MTDMRERDEARTKEMKEKDASRDLEMKKQVEKLDAIATQNERILKENHDLRDLALKQAKSIEELNIKINLVQNEKADVVKQNQMLISKLEELLADNSKFKAEITERLQKETGLEKQIKTLIDQNKDLKDAVAELKQQG